MNRVFKYVFLLLFFLNIKPIYAQQVEHFNNHLNDDFYLLNPAASGRNGNVRVNAGFRNQWVGIQNSPISMFVSGYTDLRKSKMIRSNFFHGSSKNNFNTRYYILPNHADYGGLIMVDRYGPYQKIVAHLSYAYHINLAPNFSISVGTRGGYTGFQIDASNINQTGLDNDQAFQKFISLGSQSNFDLGVGAWMYTNSLFFGYYLNQFVAGIVNDEASVIPFNRVYHLVTFGTRQTVGIINMTPSVVFRYSTGHTLIDYNLTIGFNSLQSMFGRIGSPGGRNQLWFGFAYRNGLSEVTLLENVSAVLLAGVSITNAIDISYNYEHYFSDVTNLSGLGAHEIAIGITIPNLIKLR